MDNFHLLISYLTALANFAKDFHYYCKSFGKHLFADVAYDNIYDYLDEIKENVLLGGRELPRSSKQYLMAAAILAPTITEDDVVNLKLFAKFVKFGVDLVNKMEGTTRGQNALLDEIAGHLDKTAGLLFLQLRKYGGVFESDNFKKEECEGCTQRAVDRAKAVLAKIDYDKVAKTVLDYEAQNLLVAEESTLDRVSKKLGLE